MKARIRAKLVKAIGRALMLAAGLVALVLVIAWLAGAFEEKVEPGHRAPLARKASNQPADEVHEVTKDYIEEAIGTLKAASRTETSSKVLATIQSISVTAGDQVQQGDVLIQLQSKELEARLRQAEETLAAVVATREEAESSFRRAESLIRENAVSQAEHDQAQRTLRVAQAEESRAQQAVSESAK